MNWIVWSCKWSALYANPHLLNSCWLLCYYRSLVFNMITINYCCVPFIVCHSQPPTTSVESHTAAGKVHSATQALIKKNNVMTTISTHLPDKGQSHFHLQKDSLIAASVHEKDEVTFGCSINFKGFYTIKHNLSSGYYSVSLVSLWYFCWTSKILVF